MTRPALSSTFSKGSREDATTDGRHGASEEVCFSVEESTESIRPVEYSLVLTMSSSDSFESLNTRVSQLFASSSFSSEEILKYARHFEVQEYKQIENTEAVAGKSADEIAELVKVKVFEHLKTVGMA